MRGEELVNAAKAFRQEHIIDTGVDPDPLLIECTSKDGTTLIIHQSDMKTRGTITIFAPDQEYGRGIKAVCYIDPEDLLAQLVTRNITR